METTLCGRTGARVQPRAGLGSKSVLVHARTPNLSMAGSHVERGTWDLTWSLRNAILEPAQVSVFKIKWSSIYKKNV